MKGIMGRKVGMTQLLTGRGEVVPVTIIEAGPCFVTQIKTAEQRWLHGHPVGFRRDEAATAHQGASRPFEAPRHAS